MLFHTDIIFYIGSHFLPFSFMVRLRRLNKEMLALLDNDFFIALSLKMYGREFWDHANNRPPESSHPQGSALKELLRIEQFQLMLESRGECRWTNEMFFRVWETMDAKFLTK